MICNGCQHLDLRNSECRQLVHMAICGACLKVYPINEIRCSCGLMSQTMAGSLVCNDGDVQASAYCPLTKPQREALKRKQAQPVVKQKELF